MMLIYTNLGPTSLPLVILVNVVMYVGIFSRMIPATALMSAIPDPASRGSYMSVSSSLQQISGGFASVVAGLVVTQAADGHLEHFNLLGYVMIGTGLLSLLMMYFVHVMVREV